MRLNIKYFFLILLLPNLLFAQDIPSGNTSRELKAKEIKEFVYKIKLDGSIGDSIEVKITTLDTLGRIESIVSRDSTRLHVKDSSFDYKYDYIYDQKSRLIEIKASSTHEDLSPISKKMKYDKFGNKQLEKWYLEKKLRGQTKYKYNYKNRLREAMIEDHFPYKKYEKLHFLYNDKGFLLRRFSSKKGSMAKEYGYDENGNLISIHLLDESMQSTKYLESHYDEDNRKIRDRIYCKKTERIPEVYANINSNIGDVLVIKYEYNSEGVLISKKQWLNNFLIGLKKYHHVEF